MTAAKLRSDEPIADLGRIIETYRPAAVLVNCSVPEAMAAALAEVAKFGLPYGAYANGFTHISGNFLKDAPTVKELTHRHDLTPEKYTEFAMGWVAQGATIVGGCCEVGPAHIRAFARCADCGGPSDRMIEFTYNPPMDPLVIVYADDQIMVVDKPSGLLSVPGKTVGRRDCLELRLRALHPGNAVGASVGL